MNKDRRTGLVKGYALLEYRERKEADEAIEQMNGVEFMGKTIYVDWVFQVSPTSSTHTKHSSSIRERSSSPPTRPR